MALWPVPQPQLCRCRSAPLPAGVAQAACRRPASQQQPGSWRLPRAVPARLWPPEPPPSAHALCISAGMRPGFKCAHGAAAPSRTRVPRRRPSGARPAPSCNPRLSRQAGVARQLRCRGWRVGMGGQSVGWGVEGRASLRQPRIKQQCMQGWQAGPTAGCGVVCGAGRPGGRAAGVHHAAVHARPAGQAHCAPQGTRQPGSRGGRPPLRGAAASPCAWRLPPAAASVRLWPLSPPPSSPQRRRPGPSIHSSA
jgi:hypothetical protein